MKILDVFSRRTTLQIAKELFANTWHVATRSVTRCGPETVSWVIYADRDGRGELPHAIVAGGVCNSLPEAHEAMRQWFELWTLTGPAGFPVYGRAGW